MHYWKVLHGTKSPGFGGASDFDWSEYLPTNDGPGKWLPQRRNPTVCFHGWHLASPVEVFRYFRQTIVDPVIGTRIFLAEPRGEVSIETGKAKIAAESCRLIREVTVTKAWVYLTVLDVLRTLPKSGFAMSERPAFENLLEDLFLCAVGKRYVFQSKDYLSLSWQLAHIRKYVAAERYNELSHTLGSLPRYYSSRTFHLAAINQTIDTALLHERK